MMAELRESVRVRGQMGGQLLVPSDTDISQAKDGITKNATSSACTSAQSTVSSALSK